MVDKAKEALDRIKAKEGKVQVDGSPEQVADDDNRHRSLGEMPQPNPNRPTQTEVSARTQREMEAGKKATQGRKAASDDLRMRQAGRTMVTDTDGNPIPTAVDKDPDA